MITKYNDMLKTADRLWQVLSMYIYKKIFLLVNQNIKFYWTLLFIFFKILFMHFEILLNFSVENFSKTFQIFNIVSILSEKQSLELSNILIL